MPWRGEVEGLGVQVQAQSAAYRLPQHCRSSEPLPYSLDAESWSAFDQARSSMAMGGGGGGGGSCGDDDAEMASFPLSDYQPETWWPPINVQINLQSTVHNNTLNMDKKPTDVTMIAPFTGQTSYSNIEFPPPLIPETPVPRLEVWCPEPPTPVTIAAATTSEPPRPSSALAAVNTAIAEVAATVTPSLPSLPSPGAPAGPPSGSSRVPKAMRRKGKCASAPASPTRDASLAVQKASSGSKRPLTQRQNHIWSERQRRKGMNYLFESLRSLLPQPSPTNKTDKSTVVGEIIKYIQTLQVQLEVLTKKQQQMVAARALGATTTDVTNPVVVVPIAAPRRGMFGGGNGDGVTVVDHSGEAGSATAVSVVPPAGRESCLHSYVGANVGVHVCGLNVFITTSSPRGRRGLLHQLLLTLHRHALDVINATISSTNASVFHCLHCQASQDAELLNNNLHHALQSVINQFK